MSIRTFNGIHPKTGERVLIDETAVVIGDVTLADDVSIWPHTAIRGDVQKISVGSQTNIQDGSVLHVTHDSRYEPGGYGLEIGDGVTVGHKVILHGCQVGNHCLIGMGAVVMDGAILEEKVLLGAGSLVGPGKRLQGGHLWLGSPVRKVRPLSDDELAYLDYAAQHYVRLKDRYLAEKS